MAYSTRSRFVPTDAVRCPCGSYLLPGADCADCTVLVPTTRTSLTQRDEALAKVENLFRWYSVRYIRAGRLGRNVTPDEFVQECAVEFCKAWATWYDHNPNHLKTMVGFVVRKAAERLRRGNASLGTSLAAFKAPDDMIPDRDHGAAPDFLELDRLRKALDRLPAARREEVCSYFGAFGRRKVGLKGATHKSNRSKTATATGLRIAKAVQDLAGLMVRSV